MAGRTGSSVGVGIAITILGGLCLALFVLTAVFYGKYNKMRGELVQYTTENDQYIKSTEKQNDNVRALVQLAQKSGNKSLVGYLTENFGSVMQSVSGSSRDTVESLRSKVATALKISPQETAPALLSVVADRDSRIEALTKQLDAAEAGRKTALEDLKNETNRVKSIESEHTTTVSALTAEVGKYKD